MRNFVSFALFAIFTLQVSCIYRGPIGNFANKNHQLDPNQAPHLLWPSPNSYTYGSSEIVINDPCNFSFKLGIGLEAGDIQQVFTAYKQYMFADAHCGSQAQDHAATRNNILNFTIQDIGQVQMDLGVDESYNLTVQDGSFQVYAKTYVGALRALETFSQLVSKRQDPTTGLTTFFIPATPVVIQDFPRFAHRGFMLDTSRHFISKTNILKILDGMMFSKLNVFHWHLADSDSFSFFFPSHPNLTKFGAFSSKQVYSQQDIQDIVNYAYVRGIRIIPELDSPAHVGGWAAAPEAAPLINCTVDGPFHGHTLGTPLGQINPTLNATYDLIKDLLNDLNTYFPWEFVHLGNDEVDPYCWNNTDIYNFMTKNNIKDFPGLFNYFVKRERELVNQNKTRMYWLFPDTAAYLQFEPSDVLQWWGNTSGLMPQFDRFPNNKFILSNYDYFYFDCGFGDYFGSKSWCDPLHTWLQIYRFELNATQIQEHEGQILGLEACLWSEMVNDAVVLDRAFPRAASLGEKAWSSALNEYTDTLSVFKRLNAWISRNNERGVPTGPISSGFCELNPTKCFT